MLHYGYKTVASTPTISHLLRVEMLCPLRLDHPHHKDHRRDKLQHDLVHCCRLSGKIETVVQSNTPFAYCSSTSHRTELILLTSRF